MTSSARFSVEPIGSILLVSLGASVKENKLYTVLGPGSWYKERK